MGKGREGGGLGASAQRQAQDKASAQRMGAGAAPNGRPAPPRRRHGQRAAGAMGPPQEAPARRAHLRKLRRRVRAVHRGRVRGALVGGRVGEGGTRDGGDEKLPVVHVLRLPL
jgi:hypothetical protein